MVVHGEWGKVTLVNSGCEDANGGKYAWANNQAGLAHVLHVVGTHVLGIHLMRCPQTEAEAAVEAAAAAGAAPCPGAGAADTETEAETKARTVSCVRHSCAARPARTPRIE